MLSKIDSFGHRLITLGNRQSDIYAILANFSTVSNFILGAYATVAVLFPEYFYTENFFVVRCIALGASFDAVDGKLARRSKTQPRLGAQFDTAADLVSFGLAPASIVLVLFFELNVILAILFSGIYLFCASFRLSRFMIEPSTKMVGYFKGMPSPPAALFTIAWYVIDTPNLGLAAFHIMFVAAIMIASFPYTAMKVVTTLFQRLNFVYTVTIMILFIIAPSSWMQLLGILWIAEGIYFGVLGPIHGYRSFEKE